MNLYWNFAKGTSAKAQGTTAVAVGARGYFNTLSGMAYVAPGLSSGAPLTIPLTLRLSYFLEVAKQMSLPSQTQR